MLRIALFTSLLFTALLSAQVRALQSDSQTLPGGALYWDITEADSGSDSDLSDSSSHVAAAVVVPPRVVTTNSYNHSDATPQYCCLLFRPIRAPPVHLA